MTGPASGLREPPPAAPARAPPGAPAALFTVRTAPEDGRGQGRGRLGRVSSRGCPDPRPGSCGCGLVSPLGIGLARSRCLITVRSI